MHETNENYFECFDEGIHRLPFGAPSISISTCSLNLSPHPPVKNVCTCFTVAIGMRTKVLFEMT